MLTTRFKNLNEMSFWSDQQGSYEIFLKDTPAFIGGEFWKSGGVSGPLCRIIPKGILGLQLLPLHSLLGNANTTINKTGDGVAGKWG